jgi:addiction module HigA family antidote
MITLNGIDPRMIANNLEPSEPVHPGELLKEEIEYRGISQKELSNYMGISYTVLNEVLNCKRAVTAEYALLFEAALGIEAGMWIRIQADYNIQTAKKNKSFAERLANVQKITATAAL